MSVYNVEPLNKPDKVWTDKSLLNANSVVLHWNPVDTSPARIKGYFRGYRVRVSEYIIIKYQ